MRDECPKVAGQGGLTTNSSWVQSFQGVRSTLPLVLKYIHPPPHIPHDIYHFILFQGTIPFSDTTAATFVKSCGPPTVGKKKDKKTTDNGFSEESQQRHFGVTAQAFTKCRRHAKDEALMEDPLRPGKKIPWTYVDPTSDYSFRFLTWARFAGWFFSSMTV